MLWHITANFLELQFAGRLHRLFLANAVKGLWWALALHENAVRRGSGVLEPSANSKSVNYVRILKLINAVSEQTNLKRRIAKVKDLLVIWTPPHHCLALPFSMCMHVFVTWDGHTWKPDLFKANHVSDHVVLCICSNNVISRTSPTVRWEFKDLM